MPPPVTTLFLDLGGVVLTNGWGDEARRRAAKAFRVDYKEMNERHHLTFDTYEEGKLSLDEYLDRVVFYRKCTFSRNEFREFMFRQSKPYPRMIDLMRRLKDRNKLKMVAVSNEGRELSAYRVEKFGLRSLVDAFVVSSFVHYRKPDADMYRIALDIAQVAPPEVVYIDDRAMFVQVAKGLGIRGVHHRNVESTRTFLRSVGLREE